MGVLEQLEDFGHLGSNIASGDSRVPQWSLVGLILAKTKIRK
jgi:hypothetical protein